MAAVLGDKYGFEVTPLRNPTRAQIIRAFAQLKARLTPRDNLLIYYAGHGIVNEGTGFWLAADAEKDVETNWIPVDTLTRNLKAMNAKHVMIVADSCYSGTLVWEVRVDPSTARAEENRVAWLKRMAARRSRTALTSGGLEPVLDKGGGGHSIFAKAFLDVLRDNDQVLEAEELHRQLSPWVVKDADQTPMYEYIRYTNHEFGEFLFVPKDVTVAILDDDSTASTAGLGLRGTEREDIFWQSIQGSQDPAKFEAYLNRFPDGIYAELARLEIDALRPQTEPTDEGGGDTSPISESANIEAGATVEQDLAVAAPGRDVFDGRWFGKTRGVELEMTILQGRVVGVLRHYDGSCEFSRPIDIDEVASFFVTCLFAAGGSLTASDGGISAQGTLRHSEGKVSYRYARAYGREEEGDFIVNKMDD